jgi:hypothetical protein
LKEQNQYDQMPLSLLDRLQRILPLADKVADEIDDKKTEILANIIPQMYEVMHRVARFSCDYVKRGEQPSPGIASGVLMIAVRTGGRGGPAYHKEIEEMDRELAKVTEDFLRAVDVETLRVVKRSGQH